MIKLFCRRLGWPGPLGEEFRAIKEHVVAERELETLRVVLEEQYKEAYEALDAAINAGITPALIGPPGIGKSLLARKYAQDTGRPFYEVFFDETIRPSSLTGYFDPALTMKRGYTLDAFIPGPLLKAMTEGGIFLAQELNRATEYCQNTLLAPLEERRCYIPKLGHIRADERFVLIAAMNPSELAGTYRLSEALKDRIGVWIPLSYPSKEVEIKILKVNSPEYNLDESVFEVVYSIISKARASGEVEVPSIRDGIAMVRMLGEINKRNGGLSQDDLIRTAMLVLGQHVRGRYGNPKEVIPRLVVESIRLSKSAQPP